MNLHDRRSCRPAGSVAAWSEAARQDTTNGRRAWKAYQLGRFRLTLRLRAALGEARAEALAPVVARLIWGESAWARLHAELKTRAALRPRRHERPSLASCLDHVAAAAQTGAP